MIVCYSVLSRVLYRAWVVADAWMHSLPMCMLVVVVVSTTLGDWY